MIPKNASLGNEVEQAKIDPSPVFTVETPNTKHHPCLPPPASTSLVDL